MSFRRVLTMLALAALSLSGCLGPGGFYPQYSGLYSLESAQFESGAAQAAIVPQQIRVIHRMHFKDNSYQSWMKVEPISQLNQAALGGFVLPLEELTYRSAPNIENPRFDGISLRLGQKAQSPTETFCSLSYQWSVYSDLTSGFSPSLLTLQKLYSTHGSMNQQLTAAERLDPPVDEFARQEWDAALVQEKGAVLRFALTMQTLGAVYGCTEEGGGLPAGQFGPVGRVVLTYRASQEALDQMTNPVLQDLTDFIDGWDRGLRFWSQLVDGF